jgi:hypothetical protein
MSTENGDEALLARLRDLSLVDLDALLAGASGERYGELLNSHANQLCDALLVARERARVLLGIATHGPDPLILLDAPFATRARDGGREAAGRVTQQLAARAEACRALARIDDQVSHLLPRLLEADRRRASL